MRLRRPASATARLPRALVAAWLAAACGEEATSLDGSPFRVIDTPATTDTALARPARALVVHAAR